MIGGLKALLPVGVKRFILRVYEKLGGGKSITDYGRNNQVIIGKNCRLEGCHIIFAGNNNTLRIGDNCSLQRSVLYLIDDNNTLVIGDNNAWGAGVNIIPEEGTTITIGSDCQFAVNVYVRSSDGQSIISNETNNRINPALDIHIGDRCWIGENAKVLKGANISNDSVIGACSIVTKGDYEPNSVYVGNPARKVKDNIHWVVPRI